jgi:CheY-like chemotaxis protein
LGKNPYYHGEPLTVLLVEDVVEHAELIQRVLREHRITNRVVHLEDGQTAIDYLSRSGKYSDPAASPRPQVILLDLRLPKVDGLEVLRRIKSDPDLQPIPVVILTTSEEERDIVSAYQYRANSYLVKPVDYEAFANLLNTFGFYWLKWNLHP